MKELAYYRLAGQDPVILYVGILIIVLLVVISTIIIENKVKNKKIKLMFYLGLIIQLIILIIDNYFYAFPTIWIDPRVFEISGWKSYLLGIGIGRGAYNSYIVNPIYKILKLRVAVTFGAMNILFHILTSIGIYEILKKLKTRKNIVEILMGIAILSPISLVMRTGIQREAIIILFVTYSLKDFIEYLLKKNSLKMLRAFVFVGLASVFHGGVIFIASGYIISLINMKKSQKFSQYFLFIVALILFLIFKDILLEKVGGGDVEAILFANNRDILKNAGSGYLKNISTTNLGEIVIYLPLFMFYFLYSPTPEMIRGALDVITFTLNSSIFIYLTIYGYYMYIKIKNKLNFLEKKIVKSLFISLIFTVIVFSIGTRNAGTAMRHRDKVVPILIIIFGILQNRYFSIKEEKKKETNYEKSR